MRSTIANCQKFFPQRARICLGLFALLTLVAGCAVDQPARRSAPPQPAPAMPPVTPQTAPLPLPTPPQPSVQVPVPAATPAQPAAPVDKVSLLRTWAHQQSRLYQVAAPLLINNTELCPRHVRNLLGFTAKTRYSYTNEFAEAAQTALGLDEQLRVMNVLPGSAAEQAGLQKGDFLIAVEIEPLPTGPNAERDSAAIIGTELKGRSSVNLTVLRNGERAVLDISLTPACAMVIDLGNTDRASSFADGQRIMVTRGMIDFVQSDQELAYVLTKEIAHNILTQQPRRDMAAFIDRLHTLTYDSADVGITGEIPRHADDMDFQAKKLSLYLLARAGVGIDNVLDFWNRLATHHAADTGRVEPAYNEQLAETIGKIKVLQQLGAPLLPSKP